ncbi:SMI1/KNR4 family protein [Kitasatospora sp. NPDC004669]|uniref:SMI1/KNR4 family protein n=1 Tax=Kitasatospora sp. NPDC004669 TaxID=3154555 RepID=UPI00339E931B
MENSTWVGVRERVRAVAAAPRSASVFGAPGHRFLLEEPLTAADLAELESQVGVVLPTEYREFLLTVGAGGAGLAYGVFPARRVEGRWWWEGDGADLADLTRLAEPFPRQGPHHDRLRELWAEYPDEDDCAAADEDYAEVMEAWEQRWEPLMFSSDRTVGAVLVCHLGCAARQWLVVSGPERGRIWRDDRADGVDLVPLLDDQGEPVTFARWYLDWLEDSERQVQSRRGGVRAGV